MDPLSIAGASLSARALALKKDLDSEDDGSEFDPSEPLTLSSYHKPGLVSTVLFRESHLRAKLRMRIRSSVLPVKPGN